MRAVGIRAGAAWWPVVLVLAMSSPALGQSAEEAATPAPTSTAAAAAAEPGAGTAEAGTAEPVLEPALPALRQVVQSGDADQALAGKALRTAVARVAPVVTAHLVERPGEAAAERVIELTLAARAAQAAGNAPAAATLLKLAQTAYRAGWSAEGIDSVTFNDTIRSAVALRHGGVEGLSLDPPDGLVDVCLQRRAEYIFPYHAPWECFAAGSGIRVVRVAVADVDPAAAGSKRLYDGPRDGADPAISIDEVAYAKDAYVALRGKQLRKRLAALAPDAVGAWLATLGETPEARVVELVRAARSADASGAAEAARAYLALAVIAYRSGWTAAGATPAELNEAIAALVAQRYPEEAGLDVFPPEGWVDICLDEGDGEGRPETILDQAMPWRCEAGGGRVLRVPSPDVDPAVDSTDELDLGDE